MDEWKKKSVAFPHTINKQLENGGGGVETPSWQHQNL